MSELEPTRRAELERREELRGESAILVREIAILALIAAYVVVRLLVA